MSSAPQPCENCQTPLVGPYCHVCGQRLLGAEALAVSHVARELLQDVSTLDTTTGRTLLGVVRPGWLTREYLAGRRQPYLSPLKTYLLCAALFFLLAPLAGYTLDGLTRSNGAMVEDLVRQASERRNLDRAVFAERFDARFQGVYTASLAISVVGAATVLAGLFRQKRLPFGAHVVFALHYVAFIYLWSAAIGLLVQGLHPPPQVQAFAAIGGLAPYLGTALARVYGDGVAWTAVKTLAMMAIAIVVDGIAGLLAIAITMRLI